MELTTIALRTIFLYIIILFVFRVMGKREIGELSVLDLVVFIMLAEMAVIAIEDTNSPLIHTVLPMLILMVVQITLAYLSLKSQWVRDLIDGKPSVLINKGNIDEKEMKKQRYNLDDLLVQLREKNIKNIGDVEFAILEPSGKLSVFEKNEKEKKDEVYLTFPFPVIMDGKVQEDQLEKLGKTNFWLRRELKRHGYNDMKKILFCAVNNDGSLYVDLKDL